MAGQSDVLQASLEKTILDEQLSSLRAEQREQAARFNALQGFSAGASVPPIGPVLPGPEAPAVADLVRRAEKELALARLESRPDWTLMGYYGRRRVRLRCS